MAQMADVTAHMDMDNIRPLPVNCRAKADERRFMSENGVTYYEMLGKRQCNSFMYSGGVHEATDTALTTVHQNSKFLLSRPRTDEFGGLISGRPTYVPMREPHMSVSAHCRQDFNMAETLRRSDSLLTMDGEWSSDDEESTPLTQAAKTKSRKNPRTSFLPLDSDGESEIDFAELRLDQEDAAMDIGSVTILDTNQRTHNGLAELQEMATSQQIEAPPPRKKFRGLRKAFSRMRKACIAAVAAFTPGDKHAK